MVGLPGDNYIHGYYRTSVTKNCCALGRIDCAPGLKYLDTPECDRWTSLLMFFSEIFIGHYDLQGTCTNLPTNHFQIMLGQSYQKFSKTWTTPQNLGQYKYCAKMIIGKSEPPSIHSRSPFRENQGKSGPLLQYYSALSVFSENMGHPQPINIVIIKKVPPITEHLQYSSSINLNQSKLSH